MKLEVELMNIRRQADGLMVAGYSILMDDLLERKPVAFSVSGSTADELAIALKKQIDSIRPALAERTALVELGRAAGRKAVEK